jgi:type II secretory pathway component PulC
MGALKLFIWLFIFMFSITGCQKKKIDSEEQNIKAAYQQKLATKEQGTEEAESLLGELRQINPFLPEHVSRTGQKEAASVLKGIFWDEASPYAIIGERVIVEGDSLEGKRVRKINRDSVILDNDGLEETLRLKR